MKGLNRAEAGMFTAEYIKLNKKQLHWGGNRILGQHQYLYTSQLV